MSAPERFAAYLLKRPYHPRSNDHSNALLQLFLDDLLSICPRLAEIARTGRISYQLNRRVRVGTSEWNVDLVLGPPAEAGSMPSHGEKILRAQPATFHLACEAKSIMTEHRKAQRNRQRDLDALHQFMHRYDQNTIVAAVTVVNVAEKFRSPLRRAVTTHNDPVVLVRSAVDLLSTLPLRSQPGNGPGLEANSVIVIEYDNSTRPMLSRVCTAPPAPQPGDPLHWNSFIRRICDIYLQRWSRSQAN